MPDWFDKLQAVFQSQQETNNEPLDTECGNIRDKWMILTDLHTPFDNSDQMNKESSNDWQQDRAKYTDQQIGEMSTWIKTKRQESSETVEETYVNIDISSFSEMQGLAYNIVKDRCEDISDDKQPLCLIINGFAGTRERTIS